MVGARSSQARSNGASISRGYPRFGTAISRTFANDSIVQVADQSRKLRMVAAGVQRQRASGIPKQLYENGDSGIAERLPYQKLGGGEGADPALDVRVASEHAQAFSSKLWRLRHQSKPIL